jgi:putative acetyltransferase
MAAATTASCRVRPARADDAAAIHAVHTRAIRVLARSHYTADELEAWAGRAQPGSYLEPMRTRRMFVAERASGAGPRIVGFAQLDPAEGVVEAIYVDPDHARGGIGAALFATLEAAARAAGLPGLVVDAALNSVPFYLAMGCRQRGLDRHELAPGISIACAVLEKRLGPAPPAAVGHD